MMLETDDDKKDSLIDAEAELNSCVCKIVAAVNKMAFKDFFIAFSFLKVNVKNVK